MTKKVQDLENELAKLSKNKTELAIEKDQIERERLDLKIGDDRQKNEMKKMKDLNDNLL